MSKRITERELGAAKMRLGLTISIESGKSCGPLVLVVGDRSKGVPNVLMHNGTNLWTECKGGYGPQDAHRALRLMATALHLVADMKAGI